MLTIYLHPQALKNANHIPKNIRLRVFSALTELEQFGHPLKHRRVIKLEGTKTEDYRLRVGNYRIKFTFQIQNKIIYVTHIEHRQVGY